MEGKMGQIANQMALQLFFKAKDKIKEKRSESNQNRGKDQKKSCAKEKQKG